VNLNVFYPSSLSSAPLSHSFFTICFVSPQIHGISWSLHTQLRHRLPQLLLQSPTVVANAPQSSTTAHGADIQRIIEQLRGTTLPAQRLNLLPLTPLMHAMRMVVSAVCVVNFCGDICKRSVSKQKYVYGNDGNARQGFGQQVGFD